MELEVQVSIGEAIDKLTILDIKRTEIRDPVKRAEVIKEYTSLSVRLESYLPRIAFLYSILLQTNKYIWDLLDEVKTKKMSDTEKLRQYEMIWDENDRRFRIKNKINVTLNSNLKEQKGYANRKVFVLGHLGMGDMFYCIGLTRYLSTLYDEVKVVCKKHNLKNLQQIYADDASITFYPVENDFEISPAFGVPGPVFEQITAGYDVIRMGVHSPNFNPSKGIQRIPTTFYEDAKVPWHTFWTYFSVAPHPNPLPIPSMPYVFTHSTSSEGPVFTTDYIEKTFKINKDNVLLVDPCFNHYPKDHELYELAQTYVGHNMLQYGDVMRNAGDILVADSSFMCYAWHLELKAECCYIYSRGSFGYKDEYMHLWSDQYIFPPSLPRKAFKQVY